MSLSKIGKVSNAVKLLNTAATSGDIATGISSLSNSLRAAGNMSAGVNWISKYGKVLDSGIAYQALKQAFPEESLTEDMLAKIGYTANGAGKVGNASKFSSVGSTFAGLGTFLKSIWPVLAVVGGIAAGTAAWKWADDKFTITKATAKKHSDESAQAYQNAKTELSTKQSQYDTNQDRIHELRATQNRTSDENAELSQLTKENSLLGTQVSVQKKLVDAKAQQQAIDADMNLNKKYTTSQAVANEYSDSVVAKQEDIVEETTRKVNELAELQKKRDAAYQKLDQMSADDEGFTEQQNIANQMDDRVSKKQSEIADAMDEISDDYNRLFDEDTGALINPKTKDTAKSVEDLFSLYGRVTDSAQEETDRINNIFAKAKFDGVEDQLVNAGKSGGTDAVKAKISEIDGLQEALDNAGISADTLASNIMAIARPDEKNLEGIKENLKDIFDISADLNEGDNFVGPSGNLYNFFKDKTDKQIEDFWNYYSDQGLDGSDWNYMDLASNFNKSQEKAKIEAESKTFSSLFKNSAEDTATDLDTITDNFQTDMSNIKSSMDSIKSGTFQNSDITDLIQQFPELATETDNLQQGLQNLAFDKASDAIGKIRDSVKDVTDPKQLAAADKYIQSIMDTMDLSGFDMSNAKSAILGNLTKNLADKHMASVTTPNLVNQLMSEYGNDEIAVQAIMKLSLDPSMANADLDTWKSKIEDTKVQIQLDTSAKNLDNLSKELTRLQTDASNQQTRLNNKSAYNMKATASDYTNLIENGDKQIENLNNQIKEYQNNIDALKNSKGLSPLSDEDNEQIKQWQDQIQASQMSIENMKAYASGTVTSPGVMKAYAAAGNTPGFHFQGGAATVKPAGSGNSGNSGNSGLQHAIEDNTDAVSNNSDDTSDAADEVSEALQNVIKKLNDNSMDWVEVAMDRLDRITSRYTDLAESDYSHYTKAQKYYNKALENTDKEIKAAKESISVYKRKSEEVANNGEVSKYLTPALKKKVQDGTINIETLDANQKAAVEAYKQWYDKYLDAVQKYRDKKTQELDLAKSKVDNVYDSYDLIISKRKAKEEYYAAKAENRIKSGKSQKVGSVYWKDLKKQVSYAQYQKDWMLKERDKVQQSMTDYLNVNGHNKKDKAYQEMKKNLTDLNTSIVEADTHIQEAKAALEETRENLKQWQIDRWERAGDKQDASLSYKKNADDINYQLSANDYEERLKTYDKTIRADEAKRQLLAEEIAANQANGGAWSNEEMQKKIEEYDNLTTSIIQSKEAMQQLAQEEIDFRFKPLDEAQNKLSNLVSELQTAQKLLGDTESFYNDDGAFSTNGLTNILLVQEQIDATKDKIANYREGLNKLDEMYKNGAIGPEYYKTKTDEMLKSLQQESATLADLKQNLLDMYTTQVTKENDLLQENIEKRKDALAAKEKYYDYDKTLKKKTKDINTLKAQIAALEGTSNAASKARLEKLRAELADAEDDMADTMHQHEVDMKNTGYENFSDEANKALDNTLDAVKKNAAFQEAIIGSMLSNVKANYDSTYKHLGDVMDQYGMKVSQTYSQMITKAADFNTAAVNATKAWEGVTKIDTSKPYGGSTAGNNAFNNAMNNAGSSQTAGSTNIKPNTDYTLKLSDTDIYLTYSHIKKQLKATWSPKKPEHSDIEWKSSDESIAKVSSDGTVRGVSSGLNKNGLMARDESKTRKCIITAIGGGGLAKATCTVHVMPDSHYEKIKDYADKAGIKDTSGNNLRDAMEYAYKNGANHSDQSYTAVEGFKKAYLKDWTNSLSNRPDGATDVPAGVSPLIGYFNAKGKKVGPKEMQQLADILQINTPGVKNYDSWGSTLKNKILKAYKSYGFSKGGVVRKGIPASILDIIGGDALIPRGDSMLIGANPGETVLTKEFTDQLKPTVATLNEFNARMAKPITPILPSSSNNTSMNSECNITINVDKINSEQDIKKLAYQIGDIITERNKRDWKKVR